MKHELPGYYSLNLGCDPELFLSREIGKVKRRKSIVGSELVIPKGGIVNRQGYGSIVRDGVQVELHPLQSSCRESLAFYTKELLIQLTGAVRDSKIDGLKIDFTGVVRPSKGDLMKLDADSRQLGCQPSLNAYGRKHIIKNGEKYLIRSAAGHVHVGSNMFRNGIDPVKFVKVLDALVGNTCVLIDRDPLVALRRKVYGRAGEYRLPRHGLEYRTLSNFWLQDYKLMAFVMGMTKIAVRIMEDKLVHISSGAEKALMDRVDSTLIEKAINTNDYDLALSNWKEMVRPFLDDVSTGYAVNHSNLLDFEHFLSKIRTEELAGREPLGYWFNGDPLQRWIDLEIGKNGFESFMKGAVRADRTGLPAVVGVVVTPAAAGISIIGPEIAGARIVEETSAVWENAYNTLVGAFPTVNPEGK